MAKRKKMTGLAGVMSEMRMFNCLQMARKLFVEHASFSGGPQWAGLPRGKRTTKKAQLEFMCSRLEECARDSLIAADIYFKVEHAFEKERKR